MGVFIAAANMTIELGDRVLETTQTTGTGTYSLDGVSTDGRQSFVNAIGTGNRTLYSAELGTSWEIGVGTVTAGAPATLSRDFILKSSNSDNAVNWQAGVKSIYCDATAALLEQIISLTASTNTFSPGDNATAIHVANDDAENVISLSVAADGTGTIELNGDNVYSLNGGVGTLQSLSGSPTVSTALFTGIRSDAKRITLVIADVSCAATNNDLELTIGDVGGIETSGYESLLQEIGSNAVISVAGPSDAFMLGEGFVAAGRYAGTIVLTLLNPSTNLWVMNSWLAHRGAQVAQAISVGQKSLTGTLTQVQLQLAALDGFDGGSVNIMVE